MPASIKRANLLSPRRSALILIVARLSPRSSRYIWSLPVRLLAPSEEPYRSNLGVFRQRERVFNVHTQIADRVLDLRMPEQDLPAGLPVAL